MKEGLGKAFVLFFAVALLAVGCNTEGSEPTSEEVHEIGVPTGPGSGQPYLHADDDGKLYLSWQESVDTAQTALRYAAWESEGWSEPRTIYAGRDWFVNWADFPSLVASGDSLLAAHVLVKSGPSPYAYDVHVVRSSDGGESWSDAVVPHRDGTQTEHGFVSLVPGADEGLGLVWLDGRKFAAGTEEMTLRYATLAPNGSLAEEELLDERACDCCQTAAVRTPRGLVVAYRDRSPEEVRDISIVRREEGRWSSPRTLHEDGWEIAACPVNGPALAADGERVAAAWFTGANDRPRVKVAFSEDEGTTFGNPIILSEDEPAGRVDVLLLEGGTALVSWVEGTGDEAELRVQPVSPDRALGEAVTVAPISAARGSGFPQMAAHEGRLFFAWTAPGDSSRVQMATTSLARFQDLARAH